LDDAGGAVALVPSRARPDGDNLNSCDNRATETAV